MSVAQSDGRSTTAFISPACLLSPFLPPLSSPVSPLSLLFVMTTTPAFSNLKKREGRRPNGFLGLSLNDRTILFLLILLDKTVSVRNDSLCITTLA